MRISELKKVMQFVVAVVKKNKIEALYNDFNQAIQQSLRQRSQTAVAPARDKLYTSLRSVSFRALPYTEQRILEAFEWTRFVGETAITGIENTLRDENFDPIGVADKINAHCDQFKKLLEKQGMIFSGVNPETKLCEIIELKDHPWFVATQFHPEFLSRPDRPHPLFKAFIGACVEK